MPTLKSIKLHNFKKFRDTQIDFQSGVNVLIGDNESGKSTILSAIDLVICASRSKVEKIGIENLFNKETINDFFSKGKKRLQDLPELYIEVFFENTTDSFYDGEHNSQKINSLGVRLHCKYVEECGKEISEILAQSGENFPFEYYSIHFNTFAGQTYNGFKKICKHLLIDASQVSSEYAIKTYVNSLYQSFTDETDQKKHKNEYRTYKNNFSEKNLQGIRQDINKDYTFSIKNNSKASLENDLTIQEAGIDIDLKGKGKQCMIKTDFILSKSEDKFDILLLEEPENHLSHLNSKKLIDKINKVQNKQLIISTHSNMFCSGLNLQKAILLNSSSRDIITLSDLRAETANFFMKSPNNSILDFILSKKVLLLEGSSEYILLPKLYSSIKDELFENYNYTTISINHLGFKRYLEIAKLLNIKTAFIRDNDGNINQNIINNYKEYDYENIKCFYDLDEQNYTFEISIYNLNKELCNSLFSPKKKEVHEYMLDNKTRSAFELASSEEKINVPDYIRESIEWIES